MTPGPITIIASEVLKHISSNCVYCYYTTHDTHKCGSLRSDNWSIIKSYYTSTKLPS